MPAPAIVGVGTEVGAPGGRDAVLQPRARPWDEGEGATAPASRDRSGRRHAAMRSGRSSCFSCSPRGNGSDQRCRDILHAAR